MDAILRADDPNHHQPRQLASLSHHSGTIHTVRFAPNNRYLASGADDKIVCVYALEPSPPPATAFGSCGADAPDISAQWRLRLSLAGSNESAPTEYWRVYRRLIGHENDVQDLAWSPDSSLLVSVGLDSKVVVWSGYTFEKLKTLACHHSHVKGVTFDPANKYFATASDDRTMKIVRYTPPNPTSSAHDQASNFVVETTVSVPFHSSPLTTYFRRCSWSPDAGFIAAANAVNGPLSSAAIVFRGSWQSDINLIGHEGPVEVCAFSPRLHDMDKDMDADDPAKPPLMTVCACAGQDRSLSVWATGNPRPLLVAFDLTLKAISDLAWHPNGESLFLTARDGSIMAMSFLTGEIGEPAGPEENELAISKFGAGRRGAALVEGAAGLVLEDRSKAAERNEVKGRMGALMGGDTAGGDRQHGTPATANGGTNGPDGSSNGRSDVASGAPDPQTRINESASGDRRAEPEKPSKADDTAAKVEKLKQRVTITKDGKKRIAPMLVSGAAGTTPVSMPKPQPVAAAAAAAASGRAAQEASKPLLDLSDPCNRLPEGGIAALLIGNKRRLAVPEGRDEGHTEKRIRLAGADGAVPILINGVDGLAPPPGPPGPPSDARPDQTPNFLQPAVVDPSLTTSQLRLAVPKIRPQISCMLESGRDDDDDNDNNGIARPGRGPDPLSQRQIGVSNAKARAVLEVRNPGVQVPGRILDRTPARITVTKAGQMLWQDFLLKSVLLVAGNPNFWAAACEEGSIYVWTPAGRRLLNAIVVESQPVVFECLGWWLLCVTAVGMCHVWDLKSVSCPHAPVSLAPVLNIATTVFKSSPPHLQQGPALTSARINSQGRVVVTLTNGDGYAYSPSLMAWQRLSEAWWAVGSQYWNSTDTYVGNISSAGVRPTEPGALAEDGSVDVSAGIIPELERRTNKEMLVRQRGLQLQKVVRALFSREGYSGLETSVSIAHLEDRIAAALQLGSSHDFRINLFMYAKRIGAEGLQAKVEELLKALVGDVFTDVNDRKDANPTGTSAKDGQSWNGDPARLCGWDRRELLKGVVLILGMYQLLYVRPSRTWR